MRARDDLIATFSRTMPARVAEATELWLAFEQGKTAELSSLRRLLHTIKGEAHMLELELCGRVAERAESLVEAVRKVGEPTALAGDALLGAFEALGMVSGIEPGGEVPDLSGLLSSIDGAIQELEATAEALAGRPSARPVSPVPAAGAVPYEPGRPSLPVERPASDLLSVEEVRPLVSELKRLYAERSVFHQRLREAQRMLRALLVEIDPRRAGERLEERITKTLGYGLEVERRLSAIRAEWSSNEFSVGLALEELDSSVRRASVVSTDRLLNQVRRVGRSTARTLGKEVELEVSGDAILDAAVAQRLEPALLHLVRNAIDHGIEPAELRRARGKPEAGRVRVSIRQTESSVTVVVEDDGGGVDFERLRTVLGRRDPALRELSDEELLPYLFEQGVTTSEQVTSISGRGVGLDVVAREVGGAGGQTRIESRPSAGTRVLLELPATLRGELAVPIWCGQDRYAVPSRAVHSVVRLERMERTSDATWIRVHTGRGSELVRLFSLASLLGRDEQPRPGEAALVVYYSSGLYALSVAAYDNPRPIMVERCEQLPFRSPLVRGVSATPDGGVMLLLDIEALYAVGRGLGTVARGRSELVARTRTARALVVEDAPVARELLCGILRSLGLEVVEASDGREGLMRARSEPPDLVLTDIEMPYMDGVEMLTHFRTSPQLADVPVIVLTTAAGQHRAQLEPLGVVGVLSKQRFVEGELRELVNRCLQARA